MAAGQVLYRAHDHCPLKVKSFKTRYGVFNFGPYTKSHCACDKQFYDCLKNVDSDQSKAVGDFFFNVIGVQCVEKRVKRRCVNRTHIERDHTLGQSRNTKESQDKTFDIGLALGIQNVTKCLVWQNEPQDTAKFVIVNAKKHV